MIIEKGILPFVTTWMRLKSIMLREMNLTEKGEFYGAHMWNQKNKQAGNKLAAIRDGDVGRGNE